MNRGSSEATLRGDGAGPADRAELVDRLADGFEAELRAGRRPRIADYLADAPEHARAELAEELHGLQRDYRERPPAGSAAPPAAGPLAPGATLGGYELLEVLGQGGMGVVYKARQRAAERLVAVKVIRPERLRDLPAVRSAELVERFRREAVAAARLTHPNTVTVYEVGEAEGRLFYSMRLVEGPTLRQAAGGRPVPPRAAAAILEPVAGAVQDAHDAGILHRDLKPSNILLARPRGEGAADLRSATAEFRPFVADFGLAKVLSWPTDLTAAEQVLGTPAYLAPEAIRDPAAASPASDVYALGATLYELLAGRPPLLGDTPEQTLAKILTETPPHPRTLHPAADPVLSDLAMRCLARDPSRRPARAGEFADALSAYLRGERPATAPPARRAAWVIGTSAVAVALVAAAAWGLRSAAEETPAEPAPDHPPAAPTPVSVEPASAEPGPPETPDPAAGDETVPPPRAQPRPLVLTLAPHLHAYPRRLPAMRAERFLLTDAPPEPLKAEPKYVGRPRYAGLRLGSHGDVLITVAVDEPPGGPFRIFVDRNNNNDLTDDGDLAWDETPATARSLNSVELSVSHAGGAVTDTFRIYRMKEKDQQWLFCGRTSCRDGSVEVDGRRYELSLVDDDSDGCYHRGDTTLYIDLDGDGRFDHRSLERQSLSRFLTIGQRRFRAGVSPDGRRLALHPVH